MPNQQIDQLGTYVVLEPLPVSNKTKSGIILLKPQTSDRIGMVLSAPEDSQLKPGYKVLYASRGGTALDLDGKQVGISEDNIHCILNDE
jgi:co-chaperonin GroES (HSP10)